MLPVILMSLFLLYFPLPGSDPSTPWHWLAAGVLGVAGLNALLCWIGSAAAARLGASGTQAGAARSVRTLRLTNVAVLGCVALDVFVLRWPLLVEKALAALPYLPLAGELMLLGPALVMIATAMTFHYRLRHWRLGAGLRLHHYLALRMRTEVAIVLAPWLVLALASDVASALLEGSRHSPYGEWIEALLPVLLLAAAVAAGPWLLRAVWRTSPLSAGPLRERLEGLCRATRFRVTDILVWHTYGSLPNAAVIGVVPWVRYVLLTDALLESCTDEEIESVFAHEIGHVRHHHLTFYLLFAAAFAAFYANIVDVLSGWRWVAPLSDVLAAELTQGQAVVMLVFAAFYWMFVFGFLSRRLEQQADVFAVKVSSGPSALIAALQKLALLSGTATGVGSWRHFSISRRTRLLAELPERPDRLRRAERTLYIAQWLIAVLFLVAVLRLGLRAADLAGS